MRVLLVLSFLGLTVCTCALPTFTAMLMPSSLFATSIITQVWSTSLLLFCTFVLFVCLLRGWTTSLLPQVANIFEVLVLLVWIALLEGVFTSIVGLKYVHERRYLMHTVLFLFQA